MMDAAQLLHDLVSIPSINPMGRPAEGPEFYEYRVTDYLERFFRDLNVPFERQRVAEKRENIVARFDSPSAQRTIIFEAHQDTVPVDNMTIAPFAGHIENGRMYGRGACDIKGGMTSMLLAFARLVRERTSGSANVIMACVVDEEFQFKGISEFVNRGGKADMAIVAEPTLLNIVHTHKGAVRWHLFTDGLSCHSCNPEKGINAIYRMGKLLIRIEEYAKQLPGTKNDPILGPPTLSVGRIEGGMSVNTVPDVCRIEIDRRVVGGEDPALLPDHLHSFLRSQPDIDFEFRASEPWLTLPALEPAGSEELRSTLGYAVGSVVGSHSIQSVPYGTDAPILARSGIPTVVFGPGDIAQAHTSDEWIELSQVEQAAEILFRLAAEKS